MTDINNFSEINDNFDTIKTLLNSIRAQGILNTSDVDKLLTGINSKLEKINTEEDIDLIKIFLSELKQNLDERHGVLVAKFAAIESLFTNLLKNSSELPKSTELKELFDIVATNLSVFSREVVSQKDILTDISLRVEALRSDDSNKKDIIKNITLLKPDLERLNNGFDTIVISLNDNFKTIIKTITSLDKTNYFDKFSDSLNNVEMISNTLLSAIQVVDKKSDSIKDLLGECATKADLIESRKNLLELVVKNEELLSSVNELSNNYLKFDTLSDKIDASVGIIATLKSNLEELDDKNTNSVLSKLNSLETQLVHISTDSKFEEFKNSLKEVVENIANNISSFDANLKLTSVETEKILTLIKSLDINLSLQAITSLITSTGQDIKFQLDTATEKINTYTDVNITKVLNDISSSTESLSSILSKSQTEFVVFCEKYFNSVFENVAELKKLMSQIDENSVSANNAIFSSITDRLTIFENGLIKSLESQEKSISYSSAQLIEQIENIKNISGVLDYKLDTSVVESNNLKQEFSNLKTSVEAVLALDFVNVVKDLRVDLYASKQDIANSFDAVTSELSESLTNDLYGKYELLISKLDTVEDALKKSQSDSLAAFKVVLDNISASIVDVISYVSEQKNVNTELYDSNINELKESIKENNLNYVENVRDIVDVIRIQVENNIKSIEEDFQLEFGNVKKVVSETSDEIKKELKFSYSKMLELQDSYDSIKEMLNINHSATSDKVEEIIFKTEDIKSEFDTKISTLKNSLLEKITDFKQEFTCENADNVSELKFTFEKLYNKNTEDIGSIITDLKQILLNFDEENKIEQNKALSQIEADFSALKVLLNSLNEKSANDLAVKVDELQENIVAVKTILNRVDENIDGDMTRQMSIIESNFESLVSQMSIMFDKSDGVLSQKISEEFLSATDKMNINIAEKLEDYKSIIEECFDKLRAKAASQSDYLQERIADFNVSLNSAMKEQAEVNYNQLKELTDELRNLLELNSENLKLDTANFSEKLINFAQNISNDNQEMVHNLKSQLDDIAKYVESLIELHSQDANTTIQTVVESVNELSNFVNLNKEKLEAFELSFVEKVSSVKEVMNDISQQNVNNFSLTVDKIQEQFVTQKQLLELHRDFITDFVKKELNLISKNVEKETDVIIGEVIEQFDLMKSVQSDEIVKLTSNIEELFNANLYNCIEDLKSYLDIKTDNSVLSSKLDNVKLEMSEFIEDVIANLNKMLDSSLFTTSMTDFRAANEILVNSSLEQLESKLTALIIEKTDLLSESFEDKLALFDKKFIEIVVDKYEEIKLLSNNFNNNIESARESIVDVLSNFDSLKDQFNQKLDSVVEVLQNVVSSTNDEVKYLSEQFENLKSQISNKSFDEAFQASINKQIGNLETMISTQIGYIEDISDMCSTNLPEVAELNVLMKHSLLEKLNELVDNLKNNDSESYFESELKQVKSDIITQFLSLFNQISFVAEQEEILDFIQEKHDELIKILSHIVTTTDSVSTINENIVVVDEKINVLKEEIYNINDKITSIISSEGDIDYIYSLQDLESDIANLRLALNEVKNQNYDKDFENLVSSTNQVYDLVESIKTDMAEDIESISVRTNKLLLASDESYKTLQDNLQDFRLVINDLDERTKNFVQDSGLDKIDAKLNSINSTIINGTKSNVIFNQVFEYLAEWVDNASAQINGISNKVESLDNIGQIKDMLIELKSENADSSESDELVEALSCVFESQSKKIASLESKIDKIIADSAIHYDNSNLDIVPFEDIFNKFLVAIDSKMIEQQKKIDSLEDKLASVLNSLSENESDILTKKIGGLDRKITKLSKNLEMITAHVVEK